MMKNGENYYNFIVRLSMSPQEMEGFGRVLPLIGISLAPSEANVISRVLGFASISDLSSKGFEENPYLRNAFSILSFLYISRHDPFTFNDFYKRLIFTDKDVERKVKRIFNLPEDDGSMSTERLELMHLLETDVDEWDNTQNNPQ